MAFNNVTVNFGAANTLTLTDTLDIDGNLTLTDAGDGFSGAGGIEVAGNLTSTDASVGGSNAITLDGANAQNIDINGADLPSGLFTINKTNPTDTVTLISAMNLSDAGQDLTITQGVLAIGAYDLTVNDVLTVDSNGDITCTSGTITAGSETGAGLPYSCGAGPNVDQANFQFFEGTGALPEPGSTVSPVIEATDTHQDGSNTTLSTLGITIPDYSAGDLIIVLLNIWQNNLADTDAIWPSAPLGETVTSIETGYGGSGDVDLPMIAFGWWIGTGAHTSANWDVTTDDATRFASAVIIVPAGEFDATTPIGATGKTFSTSNSTTPKFADFTANSDDTDGKLLAFIAVDQDPITGTPANWTMLERLDQGRASIELAIRDAAVTSSESITAPTWTVAGDAYTGYGFIIRPAVTAGTGRTAVDVAGADVSLSADTDYGWQFRLENSGSLSADDQYKIQYKHIEGTNTWTDVTGSSSVIKATLTDDFANGADVPEYLGGSGTFVSDNNAALESTGALDLEAAALAASSSFEGHLNFQIVSSDVSHNDTIQLRVVYGDSTVLEAYTDTPTITVTFPTDLQQLHYRWRNDDGGENALTCSGTDTYTTPGSDSLVLGASKVGCTATITVKGGGGEAGGGTGGSDGGAGGGTVFDYVIPSTGTFDIYVGGAGANDTGGLGGGGNGGGSTSGAGGGASAIKFAGTLLAIAGGGGGGGYDSYSDDGGAGGGLNNAGQNGGGSSYFGYGGGSNVGGSGGVNGGNYGGDGGSAGANGSDGSGSISGGTAVASFTISGGGGGANSGYGGGGGGGGYGGGGGATGGGDGDGAGGGGGYLNTGVTSNASSTTGGAGGIANDGNGSNGSVEIVWSGTTTSATFAANQDTILTGFVKDTTKKRLRFQVSNEDGATATGTAYRLEVSDDNPSTSCADATYTRVDSTGDHWDMVTSTEFDDADATEDIDPGLSDENTTFVAGQLKESSDQTTGITLTSSNYTEIEYALMANSSATDGATYCFRLTNAGATDNFTYTKYALATVGTTTAVKLISFKATGHEAAVHVTWETAQEIGNMGFHLYRATNPGGPFSRITNLLIPGLISSVKGKSYIFIDEDVSKGRLYYYKIEDIDSSGTHNFHGPISVDWDADGMPDAWEITHGLDPSFDDALSDPDGDGLSNLEEYELGMDPLNPDTDGDGIPDGLESMKTESDDSMIIRTLSKGVQVIAAAETGFTLELRTDAFDTETLQHEGKTFQRISIPGYIHGFTREIGKPELPVKGILLDLPESTTATLTVETTETKTYDGYRVYPVPEKEARDLEGLAHVGEIFTLDKAAYTTDTFYPEAPALLGDAYTFRNQQKVRVLFHPLMFNPTTGELTHHTLIRVRIEYEDAQEDSDSRAMSRGMSRGSKPSVQDPYH
jgi:hypothetical protein